MSFFGKSKPQDAAGTAVAAHARVCKIREARSRTASEIREAEAAVMAASVSRGDIAAAAALGEGAGDIAAARQACESASTRLDELHAQAEALAVREQAAMDEMLGFQPALQAEIYNRRTAAVEKALSPIVTKAAELRKLLLIADAVAVAADDMALCTALQESFLGLEPEAAMNETKNLLSVRAYHSRSGSSDPASQDRAAVAAGAALAAELTPFREALRLLDDERKRASAEQTEALRERRLAGVK